MNKKVALTVKNSKLNYFAIFVNGNQSESIYVKRRAPDGYIE
jgi:hypothetical protein